MIKIPILNQVRYNICVQYKNEETK